MKYKQIVISLLIGLILGLSTNAFAAVGDTVQSVFAQYNYVVNGVSQPPGVTALVYDGTSYLRTTDLGNMLGYDVTYKADTRTIEFNRPLATPTPSITTVPSTSLSTTPTGVIPSPTPSGPTPTPSATPVPTVTPTPTPVPNYAGYNAALSRLRAEVAAKNNKLSIDFSKAYDQYKIDVPDEYKMAYDIMQYNIKANNDQMELDILALKFQFNIPAQYNP